jgi:glycosyltransferase involved in cell wall biosynthesis
MHDFEWIVIDGESTDHTLQVLAEYEENISILLSEPDNGVYDAMNKGIRLAKGEYLLFLNAGDSLYNTDVLESVAKMPEVDILYGDVKCIDAEGKDVIKRCPDKLSRYYLLRNMIPHQATFYRRNVFAEYGEYDISFRIAADYDFLVKCIYANNTSHCHIPRIVSVYRTDGISSSSEFRPKRKAEYHRIRKKYFPWLRYGLKGLRMEFRLLFDRNYQ